MNAVSKAIRRATNLRYVAGTAIAAALLAGCTASSGNSVASTSGETHDADRGVLHAEEAVKQQPGQAALRLDLGQAYMKAGRFESAITAFNDAIQLGDESPRTALSLALANIAIGRNDEAVLILNDWKQELPAVDLGLAYALAGATQHGTAMLADAIRDGDTTAQARQNLAYALALEGRWRDARIMMAQDLTSDVINHRLGKWAALASQGDPRLRIAAMLGTPVRADSGQPAQLALAPSAAEAPANALSAETDITPADAQPAPNAMLADLADSGPTAAPVPVDAQPVEIALAGPSFVSMPVVQNVPVVLVRQSDATPAPARKSSAGHKPEASWPVASHGTHLVQLGSFTSEQSARRAWGVYTSRNAALRKYRMTIIPVTVNGKSYWRVAAAGFDAGTAQRMCGSIKSRGGACLTYANLQAPMPNGRGGPQMARR